MLCIWVRGGVDMEVFWCKQYNFLFSMATSTRLSFIFKDICLFVFSRYITFWGWFIFIQFYQSLQIMWSDLLLWLLKIFWHSEEIKMAFCTRKIDHSHKTISTILDSLQIIFSSHYYIRRGWKIFLKDIFTRQLYIFSGLCCGLEMGFFSIFLLKLSSSWWNL